MSDDASSSNDSKPYSRSTQFPCSRCGADLHFTPGTSGQTCPYCDHENEIVASETKIEEIDFREMIDKLAAQQPTVEHEVLRCQPCGASFDRPKHIDSLNCPFCGSAIVLTTKTERLITPKSLLPFKITSKEAHTAFVTWVEGLWFAPTKLKKFARVDASLLGIYLPYWTYDSQTVSPYTGQRGDHYWVTVPYTTMVNGKPMVRTRQEMRTAWTSARGTVSLNFDDVLTSGSKSLPQKYVKELAPWNLAKLEPYQDEYLSGFTAENYQISVSEGFVAAQEIMEPVIRNAIRHDIGGDEQRIHSLKTEHHNITFKHLLLPVWTSVYRFHEKVYRFMINARSGEVQGERPYSWVKITFAVLGGIAAAGIGLLIAQGGG